MMLMTPTSIRKEEVVPYSDSRTQIKNILMKIHTNVEVLTIMSNKRFMNIEHPMITQSSQIC